MQDVWRISRHHDLNGEGGRRASARWHRAGKPIVYLAESPAGALIEVLVHLELVPPEMPPGSTLLRVSAGAKIQVLDLFPKGTAWRSDLEITREIGDTWLAAGKSAVARVPSVILPNTWNVLLNPVHPDAKSIRVVSQEAFVFDPRLLRVRGF